MITPCHDVLQTSDNNISTFLYSTHISRSRHKIQCFIIFADLSLQTKLIRLRWTIGKGPAVNPFLAKAQQEEKSKRVPLNLLQPTTGQSAPPSALSLTPSSISRLCLFRAHQWLAFKPPPLLLFIPSNQSYRIKATIHFFEKKTDFMFSLVAMGNQIWKNNIIFN